MPHTKEFLKGFNLIKGRNIAGYVLIEAHATHETIKRYHEYQYDIKLIFQGNGDYDSLYHQLMKDTSRSKIIYGIKNPYRCTIDSNPDIYYDGSNNIVFEFTGHAIRTND